MPLNHATCARDQSENCDLKLRGRWYSMLLIPTSLRLQICASKHWRDLPAQGVERDAGSDQVSRAGRFQGRALHSARRGGATRAGRGVADPRPLRHSQAGASLQLMRSLAFNVSLNVQFRVPILTPGGPRTKGLTVLHRCGVRRRLPMERVKQSGHVLHADVCARQESGSGSYLANMVLYPSRFEFFRYLPDNIQASCALHGPQCRDLGLASLM